MSQHDRRSYFRVRETLSLRLLLRDPYTKKQKIYHSSAIDIGLKGLSISTEKALPRIDKGIVEVALPLPLQRLKARVRVKWRNEEKYLYGIEFVQAPDNQVGDWETFIKTSRASVPDRREKDSGRRTTPLPSDDDLSNKEKRKIIRRISDLLSTDFEPEDRASLSRADLVPKQKEIDYTLAAAKTRREWLSAKTGATLNHIAVFSEDPKNMQGNIENFIGVTQVPIGVAGPLKVNGQYAKGDFYVPLATTEGALIYTYTLGMQVLHLSGGVTTRIIRDETHISPLFTFESLSQTTQFCYWLEANFSQIKKHAEATTRHGKLLRVEPIPYDRNVIVKFCYSTGDAMGLNMINFATEAACHFIVPIVKPKRFYLRSNFSAIKKVSAHNYAAGMGKTVICESVIPSKVIKRIFDITPVEVAAYFQAAMLSGIHSGMIGMNGHVANGLTALFIACGQDVASIVDSHIGISNFEITEEEDLYISLKLPNLVVGTAGGGVALASQRECLELIGCYGTGKAEKFSEIAAATCLAGEIAICANVANGKFVNAHKMYGRKQPETPK
ncbi:MAG: PilZ domain-containing protein [Nitrospirae bacterium]|nr:PilZ domain-containing protein [Candidatus Manganitrophaceae bacterium]